MMQEQKFLVIGILAAIVSLSAFAGMASVNAQNMSGNATGGNMTSPPPTSPTPTPTP